MSAATPRGQVGVIGLGIMGGAIAKNLAAAGWQVIGFDIAKDRCDEAKACRRRDRARCSRGRREGNEYPCQPAEARSAGRHC